MTPCMHSREFIASLVTRINSICRSIRCKQLLVYWLTNKLLPLFFLLLFPRIGCSYPLHKHLQGEDASNVWLLMLDSLLWETLLYQPHAIPAVCRLLEDVGYVYVVHLFKKNIIPCLINKHRCFCKKCTIATMFLRFNDKHRRSNRKTKVKFSWALNIFRWCESFTPTVLPSITCRGITFLLKSLKLAVYIPSY